MCKNTSSTKNPAFRKRDKQLIKELLELLFLIQRLTWYSGSSKQKKVIFLSAKLELYDNGYILALQPSDCELSYLLQL